MLYFSVVDTYVSQTHIVIMMVKNLFYMHTKEMFQNVSGLDLEPAGP